MRQELRRTVRSGVFIAAGIVFPLIFHLLGDIGKIFLPMHVAVITAGFFLPPLYAGLIGLITPVLSSLVTGMPVLYPIAPIMAVELCVYGLAVSLSGAAGLKRVYPRLIIAMVLGRLAAGLAVFVMGAGLGLRMSAPSYMKMIVITGFPGILSHLLLIPVIVSALKKHIGNE